jgi:hypothetical protein
MKGKALQQHFPNVTAVSEAEADLTEVSSFRIPAITPHLSV